MSAPAMRPQALEGREFTACDAPLRPRRSADSASRLRATSAARVDGVLQTFPKRGRAEEIYMERTVGRAMRLLLARGFRSCLQFMSVYD